MGGAKIGLVAKIEPYAAELFSTVVGVALATEGEDATAAST
jgi:hypothetical protein